ncbi:MAG: hypothetical protein IJJ38_00710 [Lachnospiraceae bacterium]|nr:hypothetical protein [Lachnospiraceae bacterium]
MDPRTQDQIIPTISEFERLTAEINRLRAEIARLAALRDDLTCRVCPALRAIYEKEIGSVEREILAAKLYLQEKQRILELLRAQLNRRETPSYETAAEQAGREKQAFEEDLRRKAREGEKTRKNWEKTWWSRSGSGATDEGGASGDDGFSEEDDGTGASGRAGSSAGEDGNAGSSRGEDGDADGSRGEDGDAGGSRGEDGDADGHRGEGEESGEDDRDGDTGPARKRNRVAEAIKKLYRRIVKRLHPDARPGGTVTEREKELLNEARAAYERGDLDALKRIWEELEGTEQPEERYFDTPEDLEKLRALLVRLQKLTRELKAEISSIRGSFPYTMKELLENEDLLLEKREALLAELSDIREANRQLDRLIELIRAEMGHG